MIPDPLKVVFRTELRLQLVDDLYFMLLQPFVVELDDQTLIVPPDFLTDFDSVPKVPLLYLLFSGQGKKAAVMHDFLYSAGAPREFKLLGRRWADRAYWRGMIDSGVESGIAEAKYSGVRLGGESHWEILAGS